mgnify:CR=1 FL=1
MTCLLSLPDNEMCGVWIYGVLYINKCYILIILYHLLHICFLYKIMLKVFFAFLVMWYTY